jgi:hypothetical protein
MDSDARAMIVKQREGHSRVPQGHKEGGYNLGAWVDSQRTKKDALSPERRQRLDEIGLVWDPHTQQWEEGFAVLLSFKQREGHCRVPNNHKEGDDRLGSWVSVQRTKKDALSPEHRQRLVEIGFVWDIPAAHWEEGFAALER